MTPAVHTADAINVNAAIDTLTDASGGGVTLSATTTTMVISTAGDIFSDGAVSLTAAGGIQTAGDITSDNATIDVNSAAQLTGNVAIDSGTGTGTVTFSSTVTSTSTADLTIDAEGSDVLFDEDITGLGDVSISNAASVAIGDSTTDSFTASSLTQTTGSGTTDILAGVSTTNNIAITKRNNKISKSIASARGGVK